MSLTSSVVLSSGSLESEVGDSHLELLINFSQCSEQRCSNNGCLQLKKDIQRLETALREGPTHLNGDNLMMLRLLHNHYTSPCSLPSCRVPWCRLMAHRCPQNEHDTMEELMTLLNYPMLTLLPPKAVISDFIALGPFVGSELVEWEHWFIITPLSRLRTVALAAPREQSQQSIRWVVKMSPLHEGDNQVSMWRKLRGLQHPHIISHLWAASYIDHNAMVICTEYLPGRSVKDVLKEKGELNYTQTRCFFLQALKAAQKLHELHIAFLHWKCSNLLLDITEQTVKVSNFGMAVDLSCENADLGIIKLTLPADIVPTEVLQNGQLSPRTDSWGLACMVHEMVAGVRPWYHLRHESQEEIQRQILTRCPPKVASSLPECVRTLVHTCLQKSPDARLSVQDMIKHLHAELD